MAIDAQRIAVQRLLCLSILFLIAGSIPVTANEGIMQPVTRAAAFGISFAMLWLAAQRGELSLTVPLRLFPLTLAIYLGWSALSATWSLSPSTTVTRIGESIATFVYLQCLVVLLGQACRNIREVTQLLAIGFILSVVAGLITNAAAFGTPLHFWLNPDVPDRPRLTFGFLHPLGTGDILALAILFSFFTPWRALTKIIVSLPLFYLLMLSDSTAARLALLALVPLAFVAMGRDALKKSWRSAALATAATGAVVALSFLGHNPLAELSDPENSRLVTLTGRTQIWTIIFNNNLAVTPFGYGFEAARYVITPFVGRSYHAHNLYLNVMVETGLIGLMLFLPLVLSWLWRVATRGEIFSACLLIYVLALGMNNPGMFTKQSVMLAFMLSYHLPAFFPRRQSVRVRLRDSPQSVEA